MNKMVFSGILKPLFLQSLSKKLLNKYRVAAMEVRPKAGVKSLCGMAVFAFEINNEGEA